MVAFSVVNRVTHNIRGYDVSLSVRSKVCLNDGHALPLDRGGSAVLEDEFLTMASYHAVANKPRTFHAQSFSRGNAIVVRCEGSRRACPHRHLRGRRCDRLVPASHHLAAQDDGASVGACKGRLAFLLAVQAFAQALPLRCSK